MEHCEQLPVHEASCSMKVEAHAGVGGACYSKCPW